MIADKNLREKGGMGWDDEDYSTLSKEEKFKVIVGSGEGLTGGEAKQARKKKTDQEEVDDMIRRDDEDYSMLSKEEKFKVIVGSGLTGGEAKQARKKKTDQEELDDMIRRDAPHLVGKIKVAGGWSPGDYESFEYASGTSIPAALPVRVLTSLARNEAVRKAASKTKDVLFSAINSSRQYLFDDEAYWLERARKEAQEAAEAAAAAAASPGGVNPAGGAVGLEPKSQELASDVLEQEFARLMMEPNTGNLSDKEVGKTLLRRFAERFKDKSEAVIKGAVYTWWQNNRYRIVRDCALSVGGVLLFNYALPWLGGPALGFSASTFMKEMGTHETLRPLAMALVSGFVSAANTAAFSTAREALKGRNVLGAAFIQKTAQYLGMRSPHLDASILLDAAEIPIAAAMRPGTFKRIFLEPFGIWKPVIAHERTLLNEYFWGVVGATAAVAVRKAADSGLPGFIGRAVKLTTLLPIRMVMRLLNNEAVKNAASKTKDVLLSAIDSSGEYLFTDEVQKRLEMAVKEDQSNVELQTLMRGAIDSAIAESMEEMDASLEECFEKEPVEEEYVRAALSTRPPPPPPPIMEAQADGLVMGAKVSTLVALGTTAAGWVLAAMVANAVGAPSPTELASVLPAEYGEMISKAASSFHSNVDVGHMVYGAISSSIGLNGLIKRLAGKVPLPQLEALHRLSKRVSGLGQSLVGEDSSALAKEFMGIMLGTKIYTKKALEQLSWEELRAMWLAKGGKEVAPGVTKEALVKALVEAQKNAASVLHTNIVEGLASQAANMAGSTALAGTAGAVYSNAMGIYSAIADNGIIAAAAGIDQLSQRTLVGILTGRTNLDPYGIFTASARYSKDVAAVLAESGNVALLRAYEAKKRLDEYIGAISGALRPGAPEQAPLTLPDLGGLNPTDGFERMKDFTNRVKSLNDIMSGLPAPGADQMADFARHTAQLMKEADLASAANFYAKGGHSVPNTQSPFISAPIDERAFQAGKRLADEVMKRTGASVGETLKGMVGGVAPGVLDAMIASAMLGGLFTTAPPGVSTVPPTIAPPGVSDPSQAPLEINKAALEDTKGLYLDPVSDMVAMRLIELGLDSGLTALAAFMAPYVAVAGGGIGLYNQAAKWTNRGLDFATIARAVALSLDATKDGRLAKMPRPTSFRLPQAGSVKELLAKLPLFDAIAEQRKIDVYAVIAEEVTKYAAALLPGQERVTKYELFTNIARGLAGPITPGVANWAAQQYNDAVNAIRDKLMAEDALSSAGPAPPQVGPDNSLFPQGGF